jgi:hypothetical protein
VLLSIEDLVRRRQLGPARVGMSRNEIRAILGLPDDWLSGQTAAMSEIWRYGTFEIHFNAPNPDRSTAFFTDYLEPEAMRAGPGRELGRWILTDPWRRTFDATRERLLAESVRVHVLRDGLGGRLIRVEECVDLSFSGGQADDLEWCAICAYAPGCEPTRQPW